ncbi:polygalacturonase-like [Prosopis cineraria]|uniref:polygalacturonase-like n=1 Tax=Prosopis cineraria TaxID=364024 RepID=UPI00240ED097|nr:polygalacturonase-like [Prosopis cineraria]
MGGMVFHEHANGCNTEKIAASPQFRGTDKHYSSSISAVPKTFDIVTYGGVPNGDITQALRNAWNDACASNVSSIVMVPRGTFKMHGLALYGSCKAPIEVKVDGIIQGPENPSDLQNEKTWLTFSDIDSFTLSGSGIFDGQGVSHPWTQDDCTKQNAGTCKPYNLAFNSVNNLVIRGVTTKDSRGFHVNVNGCNNVTIDDFTVSAPANSINTDGLHISKSTNVSVVNSRIGTGDDCVSLGAGDKQIMVQNVNCGPGHGFSVGSLGGNPKELPVDGFTVRNCTLNGTSNGVRVKTWADKPGNISISNLFFEDITMINVQNPIIIDQEYCPSKDCPNKKPSKIQISNVTFKNIRGTSAFQYAVVLNCSKEKPCQNVQFNNVDIKLSNGSLPLATCINVDPIEIGKATPSCKP